MNTQPAFQHEADAVADELECRDPLDFCANGGRLGRLGYSPYDYHYRTTRRRETVMAPDYFAGEAKIPGRINVGDTIRYRQLSRDGARVLDAIDLVVMQLHPSVRVKEMCAVLEDGMGERGAVQ